MKKILVLEDGELRKGIEPTPAYFCFIVVS